MFGQEPLTMNKYKIFFQLLCIAGAVIMTSLCVVKYLNNDSVVSLSYQVFQVTPEDVYPSISICFRNPSFGPFVDTNNIKRETIAKMMKGQTKYDKNIFENITYEDMTISMTVEKMFYTLLRENSNYAVQCDASKCFKSYGDGKVKCFTHDINYVHGKLYRLLSIRIKKTKQIINEKMDIYFHHPGQLFRNGYNPVLQGVLPRTVKRIRFNFQSVKVLRKRKDGKEKCNPGSFDDDTILYGNAVSMFNCTAKYKGE